MEQDPIELTRDFRAKQENKIVQEKELSKMISGKEPKMQIKKITYYSNFKLPKELGGIIFPSGVFVQETNINGTIYKELYSTNGNLIAMQNGEKEFQWMDIKIEEMIKLMGNPKIDKVEFMEKLEEFNKAELLVESDLVSEEERIALEEQQKVDAQVKKEETEQIAEEAENDEEIINKIQLEIVPSKTVKIKPADVQEYPELEGGKKIEYTYSRKEGWIVLKDGKKAMGPATQTTETMYSVDENGNKEVSETSPHATIKSSDKNKKIAFSYDGQNGGMKAEKVYVNPDGTELKRKLDTYGQNNFDKKEKEKMDQIEETDRITDNYNANQRQDDEMGNNYELDRVDDDFNLETEVYVSGYGTVTLEYVMKNILKLSRAEEFLARVENAPGDDLDKKVQEVIEEVQQEFEGGDRRR